jgi:L-threonylcarbamoyladenylate synthase
MKGFPDVDDLQNRPPSSRPLIDQHGRQHPESADGLHEGAIARIFSIKGRAFNHPIALIGGNDKDLALITDDIPENAAPLMKAFWPGPLTLVFQASRHVSVRLTAGTGKIGIRISGNAIAQALAETLGRPLTATSANLSGGGECISCREVWEQLGSYVDAIIDGGDTPGGMGSTILDVTTAPPAIIREGMITEATIRHILSSKYTKHGAIPFSNNIK